jgi:hypothetical protein
MRRAIPAVLIALASLACTTQQAPPQQTPPPTLPPTTMTPPTALPVTPQVQDATFAISNAASSNNCQVAELQGRIHAWPDDVVRWDFRTDTAGCKGKRPRIKPLAEEIECKDSSRLNPRKFSFLPIEDCDRDVVADDVGKIVRITCSVKSGAEAKCYKYAIVGSVVTLDPEIEIEGPRASPPPPPVTTLPHKEEAR